MPMLADIEDPPRSLVPGLILGLVLATPVVGLLAIKVIPAFVGAVLGGASDLDARLRASDAYMHELCAGKILPERDEGLCGCVWSMEFPSLDCRTHFNAWGTELQHSRCSDAAVRDTSLSYCTCVDTIYDKMNAAGDEPGDRRSAANAFENCGSLGDAFDLPAPAELAPAYE